MQVVTDAFSHLCLACLFVLTAVIIHYYKPTYSTQPDLTWLLLISALVH